MADVEQPPLDDMTGRILEDHQSIKEAMARLQQAPDLHELLKRLEEFRRLVVPHFAQEVAPGGFFETLRARTARHFGRLAELEREHWELLDTIDGLDREARACLAGPVAAILEKAGALAAKLGEHEARENELLIDAMYTDIGEQ